MSTSKKMQHRLKLNRPSMRKKARPPKRRTFLGQAFTTANYGGALYLQHCEQCDAPQYPPREVCQHCLSGELSWCATGTKGLLLNRIALHHSLWEYFKRRIMDAPWPIATVKLECGEIVFAHLALTTFGVKQELEIAPETSVRVFSHSDCSLNSVLIAVSENTEIDTIEQRRDIAARLGLLEPSTKLGGI